MSIFPVLLFFIASSLVLTLFLASSLPSLTSLPYHIPHFTSGDLLVYAIDPSSPSASLSDHPPWPPFLVYSYPSNPFHTLDCLYPPEMPNRYVNLTAFWWQRMLEPTVHQQFLYSPIITENPSEADVFLIPHYSRMCSGLDGNVRWNAIPSYVNNYGNFFRRYSAADHVIIHSVPHYGDKPADLAVFMEKGPIIALLDFKFRAVKDNPWNTARAMVVPFITMAAKDSFLNERRVKAFVAMSTSSKGLKAQSALLRQKIQEQMKNISGSLIEVIDRKEYKTFRKAIDSLEKRMSDSKLCIVPPGDAPSSKRFYDAISFLCVPYLLADYWFLPYEDVYVDYEKCIRQLSSRKVEKLSAEINGLTEEELDRMKECLTEVRQRFTWDYKKKPRTGEGLWALSWALYDKMRMLKPYRNNEMTGFDDDEDISIRV
jgi:hypothetical protein